MIDNLRDDTSSSFYEDDDDIFSPENEADEVVETPRRRADSKLLGMTAMQRFIIATMLMIAVCTLGTMCLLLTGKIGLI
jgi:hypothetical protein